MRSPVTVTNGAMTYLKHQAITAGKNYVWFGVEGGGCSGFRYQWEFRDEPEEVDFKFPLGSTQSGSDPIRELFLVIDSTSEMFVIGCEIDYVNELGGSFLKVNNPTSTRSCGCGESFGV